VDPVILTGIGVLYLVAIADIWTSRLTPPAKVLWTVMVLFLVGVGLAAWLLTRHTAHQPVEKYRPEAG